MGHPLQATAPGCAGADDGTGAACALAADSNSCAVDGGDCVYNGFGAEVEHHESHPCADDQLCTESSMVRMEDIKTTIYEIKFPAASMGLDGFQAGFQFGLGVCINDGDVESATDGNQAGQGGWSGWAPYGIVHGGKQSENNGKGVLTMY